MLLVSLLPLSEEPETQESVSIPSNEERKQYMPIKDINNNLKVFSTVRENKKSFASDRARANIFLEFYDREKGREKRTFYGSGSFFNVLKPRKSEL
jgi:hypothetical protein